MKIAFICTSLASGRDGVGDYVRQLAESCTREGHQCLLIAVNERPSTPDRDCVHLLSTTPWAERAARLSKALADFDPDWVSWQIVSYGLHPKGIIPRDAFALADVTRRWPTQVMVHELWIGLAAGEPWKARLIGRWQKPRLLDFLRRLEPRVLHTSNPTYQAVLRAAGFRAQQLPLFGNIPIAPCAPGDAEDVLDDVAGLRLPLAPRWVAVTFGTVHPQWDAAATLRWLRAAAVSAGRSAMLLAVGRIGGAATTTLTRVGRQHPDIPIVITGGLSPEKVSALLQASDFGIATHPWALIEKSGSAAAMCEHGLPVLVPRDDWRLASDLTTADPGEPLLARIEHVPPSAAASWLDSRRAPAARLPAITNRFLSALSAQPAESPLSA